MKKFLALLMILMMLLSMAACSGGAGNKTGNLNEIPAEEQAEPEEIPALEDMYEGKWQAKVDCSDFINDNLATSQNAMNNALPDGMPQMTLSEVSDIFYVFDLTAELGNANLTMAVSEDIAEQLAACWKDDIKTWVEAYCSKSGIPFTDSFLDSQMDGVIAGFVQGIESSMGEDTTQTVLTGAYQLNGETLTIAGTELGTLKVVDKDTMELKLDDTLAATFEALKLDTTWTLVRK